MTERKSLSIFLPQKLVFETLKREYGVMKDRTFSVSEFFGELLVTFQEHNNKCEWTEGEKEKYVDEVTSRLLSRDYSVLVDEKS